MQTNLAANLVTAMIRPIQEKKEERNPCWHEEKVVLARYMYILRWCWLSELSEGSVRYPWPCTDNIHFVYKVVPPPPPPFSKVCICCCCINSTLFYLESDHPGAAAILGRQMDGWMESQEGRGSLWKLFVRPHDVQMPRMLGSREERQIKFVPITDLTRNFIRSRITKGRDI